MSDSEEDLAAPVAGARSSLKGMSRWLTHEYTREARPDLIGSPLFRNQSSLDVHDEGSSEYDQHTNVLERIASTFTSLLMPEPDSYRDSALSPPLQAQRPPRVLPSAPEGCPVAGQPIPPGHCCAWCQTCKHPGHAVYLSFSNDVAPGDDELCELRKDNLRLRKELREARAVAESAADQVRHLKQRLEREERARRQMESAVRRLKHREASLERRLRLHEG